MTNMANPCTADQAMNSACVGARRLRGVRPLDDPLRDTVAWLREAEHLPSRAGTGVSAHR